MFNLKGGQIAMSGEIKKIESIRNMAVFKDFRWASSVRDGGNNIAEFKKINILYGRNYSGKTTLSRIFRALEPVRSQTNTVHLSFNWLLMAAAMQRKTH